MSNSIEDIARGARAELTEMFIVINEIDILSRFDKPIPHDKIVKLSRHHRRTVDYLNGDDPDRTQ